jgi:hypothetical protein
MFAQSDPSVWAYIQNLEDTVKALTDKVVNLDHELASLKKQVEARVDGSVTGWTTSFFPLVQFFFWRQRWLGLFACTNHRLGWRLVFRSTQFCAGGICPFSFLTWSLSFITQGLTLLAWNCSRLAFFCFFFEVDWTTGCGW